MASVRDERVRVDRRRVPIPLPSDPVAAREMVRAAQRRRKRMLARRRRAVASVVMFVAVTMVGVGMVKQLWQEADRDPVTHERKAEVPGAPQAPAGGEPMSSAPADDGTDPGPTKGAGTFTHAAGTGPVLGAGGALKRLRIAVEDGSGQDAEAFAATVDRVLGDPRGWTADGQVRFQRVAGQAPAEFTVFLATPATSEQMCAAVGLHTARYSSCRTTGQVIINTARWETGVPDYGAPVTDYRAYVLNHEVGHELGNGHEACPGPGRAAPVMQQQTYGLQGCTANAWPFLAGQRYSGGKVP